MDEKCPSGMNKVFLQTFSFHSRKLLPLGSKTQKSHDRLVAVLPVYIRGGCPTSLGFFVVNVSCEDEFPVRLSHAEHGEQLVFGAAVLLRGSARGGAAQEQLPAGHR